MFNQKDALLQIRSFIDEINELSYNLTHTESRDDNWCDTIIDRLLDLRNDLYDHASKIHGERLNGYRFQKLTNKLREDAS